MMFASSKKLMTKDPGELAEQRERLIIVDDFENRLTKLDRLREEVGTKLLAVQ